MILRARDTNRCLSARRKRSLGGPDLLRICWGLEGEFRRGFCHGANGANSDDSSARNPSLACLVGLRPLTMRIGFSDEIGSDIARRKEGQWQGDMTGRGHGSHVVARLRPSERRPPRRLSDGERLVVHPVHDEITATANRQGGRPPPTMMVYGSSRPTKRSAAPTHRPFIRQSVVD